MFRFHLQRHPDFPCTAEISLSVLVQRIGGALDLTYCLAGDYEAVRLPEPRGHDRTDGLWRTTCFEAFVRVGNVPGYAEFNFAPYGQWAAYTFTGYREGMRDLGGAEPVAGLGYRSEMEDGSYGWSCNTAALFDPAKDWHLNLSAVIEERDGTKSYWALAHAPGPPDFHNRDCFIATLPAPERP